MKNEPNAAALAGMSLVELVEYRDACRRHLDLLQKTPEIEFASLNLADANMAVAAKAAPIAEEGFASKGTMGGTVTVKRDGLVIKGEVRKKVTWDQEKLKAIAGQLRWDEVQHYFDIKFSVPEKIYSALPPGPLRDMLTKARTVQFEDPKVTVERES